MKIAFTGSSSTGKTTLAKLLETKKIVQNYITTNNRELMKEYNIKNIDEFSKDNYVLFQKDIINNKKIIESKYNTFVTDRTYIDTIAYLLSKDCLNNTLYLECIDNMSIYDIVFYIPFGKIEFENDGFRSNNEDMNSLVDRYIRETLDKANIKYYTVNEISIDDRLSYILKIIGKYDEI